MYLYNNVAPMNKNSLNTVQIIKCWNWDINNEIFDQSWWRLCRRCIRGGRAQRTEPRVQCTEPCATMAFRFGRGLDSARPWGQRNCGTYWPFDADERRRGRCGRRACVECAHTQASSACSFRGLLSECSPSALWVWRLPHPNLIIRAVSWMSTEQ